MPMTDALPPWLPRAWRIRALLLSVILGLVALAAYGRLRDGGGALVQSMPVIFVVVTCAALWADWVWLKRNHHRVNEWGLSKGKDARKKPK
jgi:hypothetical protein